MFSNYASRFTLAFVLCLSLVATGCSAQWISIALADLPVLTQMALNISTLVSTLRCGQQLNKTEAAAIQKISAEASKDLALLQQLYKDSKAKPSADTIQQIQSVIADLNSNLPALLQASHISDPELSTRVTAAVNLILATVNTFAALIPEKPVNAESARTALQQVALAQPKDLKRKWNQQVCSMPDNAAGDSAMACPLQ
jgi:hypothetical protein